MPVTPPDGGGGIGGGTGPTGPGPTSQTLQDWWVCTCCKVSVPYGPYSGYYPEPTGCECCGREKIAVVVTGGVRPNWFNQPCNPPCEGMIDWSHNVGLTIPLNRCYFDCSPFGEGGDTQVKSRYRGCLNFTARIQRPPNCGDINLPAAIFWTVDCVSVFGPSGPQRKRIVASYSTGVDFGAACAGHPSVLEPPYFNCGDVLGGDCGVPEGFTESPAGYPNCGTSKTLSPQVGICWIKGCGTANVPIGYMGFNDALLGFSYRGIGSIKLVL